MDAHEEIAGASGGRPERLRAAIKRRDNWWALYVIAPLANRLVGQVERFPWVTPDRITAASFLVGAAGAAVLAVGTPAALAAAAVILQASFLLDCADGQLARFRGTSSLWGATLDRLLDRGKLFLVALALGVAGARSATGPAALALAFVYYFAMHMIDQYTAAYRRLIAGSPTDPAPAPRWVVAGTNGLRVCDLPLLRLAFAERYFLVSAFCLFGAIDPLLRLLAGLGLFQVIVRPVFLLLAFRRDAGRWPWQEGLAHRLGQDLDA